MLRPAPWESFRRGGGRKEEGAPAWRPWRPSTWPTGRGLEGRPAGSGRPQARSPACCSARMGARSAGCSRARPEVSRSCWPQRRPRARGRTAGESLIGLRPLPPLPPWPLPCSDSRSRGTWQTQAHYILAAYRSRTRSTIRSFNSPPSQFSLASSTDAS